MLRSFAAILFLAMPVSAQDTFSASEVSIEDYLWTHRPVIIFADSPADPRFIEQMRLLDAGVEDLIDRHVVVITDTDPAAASDLRQSLRPRGFSLVLIGKDGRVKLRKPLPWDTRELGRVIDKMPMRQQELKSRRTN
ncbi:MAG: DUF4174 domain-containing protein [Pseudoprimorskyibacter sp.]|nr:DUF4174 domain-containing protein [Pseudoprimorskyibacter sp.]